MIYMLHIISSYIKKADSMMVLIDFAEKYTMVLLNQRIVMLGYNIG